MSTPAPTPTPAAPRGPGASAAPWVPRRAARSREDRYAGGVAGGLAEHLRVEPLLVRGFFVVSAFTVFGVVLYLALWLALPIDTRVPTSSPGLESARRRGLRPAARHRTRDLGTLVAVAALAIGLLTLTDLAAGGLHLLWPAVFGVLGVTLLWLQADEAQRERWRHTSERVGVGRLLLGSGGVAAWARVLTGLGLLVAALVVFAARTGEVSVARDMVVAGVLGMAGLAVTVGPWLVRLAAELTDERAERIRTQERADVAAHLHDSVLQTLALIQRSADDPATVSRLARAQERDLRGWLYADRDAGGDVVEGTLAAALRTMAAESEDLHGVPVEVVTVGDAAVSSSLVPLLAATREAVVNAVRHSGAPRVDVYAEVAGERVEVFVRDRGRGFALDDVPADRQGVRGSIIGRMERHGGRAEVRTAQGGGVEVRLSMPLDADPDDREETR